MVKVKTSKKIKVKKKRTQYSLKPKERKRLGGKAITKQNKIVAMPNDIKHRGKQLKLKKLNLRTKKFLKLINIIIINTN